MSEHIDPDALTLTHNEERRRFEAHVGDELVSIAAYSVPQEKVRDFDHTVTVPQYGGQGVASHLVRWALDASIADGYRIVPGCTFVQDFVADHPDYADHVAR